MLKLLRGLFLVLTALLLNGYVQLNAHNHPYGGVSSQNQNPSAIQISLKPSADKHLLFFREAVPTEIVAISAVEVEETEEDPSSSAHYNSIMIQGFYTLLPHLTLVLGELHAGDRLSFSFPLTQELHLLFLRIRR
jgi:hypothetical protein